jgi:hypothetical protein
MYNMYFSNKHEFVETLYDQFRVSEKWRKTNAKRYSQDPRNAEAAKRLLELKSQIFISDENWERFRPLVSGPTCLEDISLTNREVGFKRHPATFADWLENLHSNLVRG